ncbi:MAG: hypothetical protein A4E57_02740 [Syntrophorhabdaceae bacterium PtaU1.Bin034]|jgi:hypothetical protein|nr:MAG: hypothetical protein A4E57_02740 [Syntrophorhabdaceae bacterium PtaU1.Bin034]
MKQRINVLLAVMAAAGFMMALCAVPETHAAVTLEVMNPRGEIEALPSLAPSARIADLAGKKIGIYWIGKQGGNNFWDEIEVLIKAKFPQTQVVRYSGPFDLGPDMAGKIAKECDAFIYGVGD